MTTNLPLAGLVVLDMGQIYQGPYCTLLLAKAGADVIKIEPPGGEPLRRRAPPGKTGTFAMALLNANKRAITLNLKSDRGRSLLIELAKRADVLVENFSPGTMDDLGVGYAVLSQANPRLIYATGTGFGISGPDRDNLAMDFTIQAASGMMSITGDPDGPPMKAGPTVVDFMGGIHLYAGIMTALYQRSVTGHGQLVEVAMQEAVYPTMATSMEYHVRTGKVPPRAGNRQASLASAPYNTFPATDGWVAIHVVTDGHWQNLLRAMGREDLADDARFTTHAARAEHMEQAEAVVREWTSRLPKAEVFAIASRYRIPCAPVRTVDEVMQDPHMHQRGFLERVNHPDFGDVTLPGLSLRLHGSDRVAPIPSPALGQHTDQVLHQMLGLSEAE
ncbi:MAG TPA: CoA transferase, partial [Acetobacteraceae bacterium]|nr:CoA transferase [Acetobacteraceae bacterium]